VFAAGRLIEGPIELAFHPWELDRCKEVAEKVLCDEVLIHHVEEAMMDRSDQCSYNCWVFTKDPSRIP
jgi:hypothetical protein